MRVPRALQPAIPTWGAQALFAHAASTEIAHNDAAAARAAAAATAAELDPLVRNSANADAASNAAAAAAMAAATPPLPMQEVRGRSCDRF